MTAATLALALALASNCTARRASGQGLPLALRDAQLLAWLAIEGPTTRVRLAALLWPDSDAKAASNSLRQRLFQLHRQIGAELVVGSGTLALAVGVEHDLADSDSVLGDTLSDNTEFGHWLAQQRSRRRGRMRQSLVELAELAERVAEYADALVHAQELLALEPISEDAHRRVMRLHYLGGDRAAALLAFDRCEQMLKDEVGTAPSAETLALLATLEQAALPLALASVSATRSTRRVPASVLRPPRLVGREPQWQALQDAWDGGLGVIVTGDGGMGKSRLLGDFAQSRGATLVVSARPGDERVVYATFSRLLRALPRAPLLALAEPVRRELARLLPEFGASAELGGEQERTRFFNAVSAALECPAMTIKGIVLDDLHFADHASIELLQFVWANSSRQWALAARAAEVSAPGQRWLDEFGAASDSVRLALSPLTQQDVVELLNSLGILGLVGDEHAAALLRRTGGNPLYLLEAVKAWLMQQHGQGSVASRLPATVNIGSLIERRISRLSQPAVQLARCAAVAAPDFSIELASSVLGLRALELADPWSELEAAQVLQADGAFAHDLIYEAALASVPQPIATQLHAEIARWLSEQGAAPASVAAHAQSARLWALAAPAWQRVGQTARHAARFLDASQALGRAADCYTRAGQRGLAFEALRDQVTARFSHAMDGEAQALADALPGAATNDSQRLSAWHTRLEYLLCRGDFQAMPEPGERALALARELGRTQTHVDITVLLGAACCQRGQPAQGLALLRPLEPWVREHGQATQRAGFFEILALSLAGTGRLAEALLHYQEPLRLAREADDGAHVAELIGHVALVHSRLGLAGQAVALVRQAIAMVCVGDGARDSTHVAQKQAHLAGYLRDLGHYGEAITLYEHLLERFQAEGLVSWALPCQLGLAQAFTDLGQIARAQRLLNEVAHPMPPSKALRWAALRADLAWQSGSGASEAAFPVLDLLAAGGDHDLPVAALAAARAHAPAQALALLQQALDLPSLHECPAARAELHTRASEITRLAMNTAEAERHARLALALAHGRQGSRLYGAEIGWQGFLSLSAAGAQDAADAALGEAIDGLRVTLSHVPQPFRQSFLAVNATNRDMLVAAGKRGLLLGL